ncbi:Alpha-D-kanosaminyltransferase [Rubripirellula lacrimiformis]|uniref:Alpha-D-kanosaminyltransferase n=1 Tax=Rubripirellula lacrimiformis TaxID=1930273 RepID=A0A517N5Y0_9BACT|nr:glycosyltransferase family 4 protein [Rubripirellula lacrimiformis]QDT02542.1 Alpha-D-kanosaminyltransferase [Rubripirellula lacrimiformis]
MKPSATVAPEDLHVVFLVNFVAPNLIAVCQEMSQRVGRFTILSSVAMESNRDWQTDWSDLDVRVQKTWTITRHPTHPSGYREVNYIHVPLDTIGQLRRLNPDAIVSLELGARTAWSSLYSRWHRNCAHVTAVYASERSESGRGRLRHWLRRRLLRRTDWVTYNGPSCRRLVRSLGADPARLSPWDYAADPHKPFRGDRTPHVDRTSIRMLSVGQLSERKGVMQAMDQLSDWAAANPDISVTWNLVGDGPLKSDIESRPTAANLTLVMHGHCAPEQIAEHYRSNDVMLFPTLADEWGLVVDESLMSGLPVIGSCHSQAVNTLLRDGEQGFQYDPESPGSLAMALDRMLAMPDAAYQQMPIAARATGSARTPMASADQLVDAVCHAIAAQRGHPIDLQSASHHPSQAGNDSGPVSSTGSQSTQAMMASQAAAVTKATVTGP